MEALPRFTLLGACIATGIGLAVCIALSVSAPIKSPELVSTVDEAIAADDPKPLPPPLLAEVAPAPSTYLPRVAAETTAPASPSANDGAKLVTELLDVIKLQATKAQAAHDDQINEVPELKGLLQPVAEPPAAEPLPEPRGPIVERDEGDDRLRVNVQDSDIRDVLELLSEQGELNILATKNVTGTVSASLVGVDVEAALLAILRSTGYVARKEGKFIYVGTPEDFQSMDQSADEISTRVYRPNYVRAAELNALITPLLTSGIGKVTVSTQSQIDLPSSQTQTGGDMMSGTDVVIVKDYERILLQVDQLVAEVDSRPRQVLIDAMIISVKLGDENKFGINWQVLRDKANVKLGLGNPPSGLSGTSFSEGGLNFGYVDSTLTSVIVALETIGETNVVAAPRLMCLNKQRAEIQIGSQLGYVSTTVTETSSTQAIQFLDVGTLLRLRPFISSDGTIRMEVHPELSTGSVEVDQGLTLPNKEVTQVTTNVMCQNGSTVIIGGLIREDLQSDIDQIPILGNAPLVGPLFRHRIDKVNRHEILVLITPRLVDEPTMSSEGAKLGNEFLQRQSIVFDKMSPIGRRFHGEKYLRKAKAAWTAGDAHVALKWANLSLEHDPMNRETIRLREEAAAIAAPDESIHEYLKQGTHLGKRPHKDYSRQGVPWKDPEAFQAGYSEPEPSSVGTPGKSMRIDTPLSRPAVLHQAK